MLLKISATSPVARTAVDVSLYGAGGGRRPLARAGCLMFPRRTRYRVRPRHRSMAMTTTDTPVDNGVNVQALLDAREALKGAPEGAQFTWRAQSKWINGTHSESTVKGFYGLGAEQSHRTEFSFNADHPELF